MGGKTKYEISFAYFFRNKAHSSNSAPITQTCMKCGVRTDFLKA